MSEQRTLIMVKPSAVSQGVLGAIVSEFEESGLRVAAAEVRVLSEETVKEVYEAHQRSFFFPRLLEYMTSGPVLLCVLEGENAVNAARRLIGPTDPAQAAPATLRGRFGNDILHNALHASLNPVKADAEIGLLFPDFPK